MLSTRIIGQIQERLSTRIIVGNKLCNTGNKQSNRELLLSTRIIVGNKLCNYGI